MATAHRPPTAGGGQDRCPEARRANWACRLAITGLPTEFNRPVYGIDSIQALEVALRAAGTVLVRTPEFRAGQIEQWNKPLKYDTDLFLPLPMDSLQSALQNLRYYIERKGPRRGIHPEMVRSLLSVMREVELDLATLGRMASPQRFELWLPP